MRLMAFGGPWNEQLIDVPDDSHVYFAPMPVPLTARLEDIEPVAPALRTMTYTVEKVGCHDDSRCVDPNLGWHSDTCIWTARCLVAPGYPKQRIADALNAIAGLSRIGAEHFAGLIPKPVVGIRWRVIASHYPEFVQWIVARYGPVQGNDEVTEADYERLRAEWENR
jgi:hypothetical protein